MLQDPARRVGAFVMPVLLLFSLTMRESCSAQNSRSEPFSLLSGQVESHGTMRKACSLSKDGDLIMAVQSRTGDYAMCCVRQPKPVVVRAGHDISVEIDLERKESELHVKLETDEKQIFLYNHPAEAPRLTLDKLLLDYDDLGGRDSAKISKFCIAAVGRDEPKQTIKVSKAMLSAGDSLAAGHKPNTFQDFEANNGTPGNGNLETYCRAIWFAQCEFEPRTVHTGERALRIEIPKHQNKNEMGGTVRIFEASRKPISVPSGAVFSIWVYDTQGNNPVELKLCSGDKCSNGVWSAMQSTKNNWSEIRWPIIQSTNDKWSKLDKSVSNFTHVDISTITAIEIYEVNDGIYYIDDITWQ